ncbi:hypothetical protein GCM10009850_076230 [Nonomuraea monospora]|uniref:Alpha/beta hydrolase fold-3 domain-containing protein n=1 Tax=Nonomuraea monospora TaxID=568818 RepID=A0ABN3CRT1_9ACTN
MFDLGPEARYPTAINQNHAAARWVAEHGAQYGLDGSRVAVAGDSAGGTMAAALTLMARRRGDVALAGQVLFYPVTDASFDTGSYEEFAEGGPPPSSSPGCRRRWSSPPKPTSCVTRAKRTRRSCARQACLSPRSAASGSFTTS